MAQIDTINERLEDYTEEAEAIKEKIQEIAENKEVEIVSGTDTPLSVLTKIGALPSGEYDIEVTENQDGTESWNIVSLVPEPEPTGLIAYATAQSGVTYTAVSDLTSYTDARINEISKAISNCADITSSTDTVYLSDETSISVGATRSYTLSTQEAMTDRIIGFNHDTLTSLTAYGEATATGKAGITWQMVNCLATRYKMNNTSTNAGGWNESVMRTSTLPTIKALLPSDLQSAIKLVDKVTANGGGSRTIDTTGGNYSADVTSSDDLFLLSGVEIFGSGSSYGYSQSSHEGSQYAYWVSHNQSSDRIKYYDNAGSQAATAWWERSSYYYTTDIFCYVNISGSASGFDATYSYGVAFAYCT